MGVLPPLGSMSRCGGMSGRAWGVVGRQVISIDSVSRKRQSGSALRMRRGCVSSASS
jgi:hypothetical protein